MGCNTCKTKPEIELINKDTKLCKKCFIRYFEKKGKKTIWNYNLIKSGDHIGVGVSGGKDSLTTLYLIVFFTFFSKYLIKHFLHNFVSLFINSITGFVLHVLHPIFSHLKLQEIF